MFAAVFSLVFGSIIAIITVYTGWDFIAAGLGIAICAKVYFFSSYVPLLDGNEVFAKAGSAAGLWSIVTFVGLSVAGVFLARRLSPFALTVIGGALLLMGLQPLLSSKSWSFDWPGLVPEGTKDPKSAESRFMQFSQQGDTLVVVLDTVQSDVFAEVMQANPAYQDAYSGFTYFWNAVGRAPTTLMSMLPIYSGMPYDGGKVSERYAALRRASIYADFEKQNYKTLHLGVEFYDCPAQECIPLSSLVRVGELQVDLSHYLELVELGLLRVLPTFTHKSWYNRDRGRLRALFPGVPSSLEDKSIAVLRTIANNLSAIDSAPQLKVMHLFGAHPPIMLDENCHDIDVKGKPRPAYRATVECNIRSFAEIIRALKKAGVYDNMTIVVMADHGETTEPPKYDLGRIFGIIPPLSGRRGRFGPLFAIKLKGAKNAFHLNAAPIQNSDLRATLCHEVLKCDYEVPGEDIFHVVEGTQRTREFIDFLLWQTDHRRLDGMPREAYQRFEVQDLLADADYDPSGLPDRSKFQ
jgi:hypothetical protein